MARRGKAASSDGFGRADPLAALIAETLRKAMANRPLREPVKRPVHPPPWGQGEPGKL